MNQTATKKCFQKYTAYKDSGIPWLGNIPEHWEILPGLSFIFEGKEKNTGMVRNTVLSLSYGNIRVREKEELTGLVPESFETYQLINKGDLIFRPTDLQNDKVSLRSSISNFDGIITNAYLNLRFKSNASPKFFHYFFRTIDNNKIIYGLGSGLRQNISFLDFRRFNFPFPPLPEQTAIANFLDNKTAKIDKAVSIIEKQISLLKERKQILIHELVTGKLVWNPDTKTWTKPTEVKDSGVEWIGEIPAHWEVKKIKYLFNLIQTGTTPTTSNINYFDGDVDWYNPKDLNEELLIASERKVSDLAVQKGEIKIFPGDSILVVGIGATSGKTSFLRNKGTFNQQITGFYSNINHNKFYFYLLKNLASVMLNTANYTTLPILNNEFFKRFVLVQPSFSEQQQIASHIKSTSQKIDQTISLKEREIEKLKEYKTSLINSVVTGKVRVN